MRDPELTADGPKPTLRSDVWQLGCVIANILTRKNPFKYRKSPFDYKPRPKKNEPGRKEFEAEIPAKIKEDIPQFMEHLREIGTPSGLVHILKRCFALKGEYFERYNDAEELMQDFASELNSIYGGYPAREVDAAKCEHELVKKYNMGHYSLPIPNILGKLRTVRVNPTIMGKVFHYRMFSTLSPYPFLFVHDSSTNKSVRRKMEPHIWEIAEGPIDFVGIREEDTEAVVDLHEFAEFYKDAADFNKIVARLNSTPGFQGMLNGERQQVLDEIVFPAAIRSDLFVVVGHKDGKSFDRGICDLAEHLEKENRIHGLVLYIGSNDGHFAHPSHERNLKGIMRLGRVLDKTGLVYAIARSSNAEAGKDTAKKILRKVQYTPPEPALTSPAKMSTTHPSALSKIWDAITCNLVEKWRIRSSKRKKALKGRTHPRQQKEAGG
jgi:hypothetical protein